MPRVLCTMSTPALRTLMFQKLQETSELSVDAVLASRLPAHFLEHSTYHVMLQMVSGMTLVLSDPAVYHVQLSDGRHYVNVLVSFSEQREGKRQLYRDFSRLKRWSWVDATLFVMYHKDFPVLMMHSCNPLAREGPGCLGLVGSPTLMLSSYWTDRGCLRRYLRFVKHGPPENAAPVECDDGPLELCVHVLRVMRAVDKKTRTDFERAFGAAAWGAACPEDVSWVFVTDGDESAWLLAPADMSIPTGLALMTVCRRVRAGVPMYHITGGDFADGRDHRPLVEPPRFARMQSWGAASVMSSTDVWLGVVQFLDLVSLSKLLRTSHSLLAIGGGSKSELCGAAYWEFLMLHQHCVRLSWTNTNTFGGPELPDGHYPSALYPSPEYVMMSKAAPARSVHLDHWLRENSQRVRVVELVYAKSHVLSDELINVEQIFASDLAYQERSILHVLSDVSVQRMHLHSVLDELIAKDGVAPVDAWRDAFFEFCAAGNLTFGALTHGVLRYANKTFASFMPHMLRHVINNPSSDTRSYRPRWCATCRGTVIAHTCPRCHNPLQDLANPMCVRLHLQICGPVLMDTERVYLREGFIERDREALLQNHEQVPAIPEPKGARLAAAAVEGSVSFDVTDGEFRLAVNVREERFLTTMFHVQQAGRCVSEGGLILLTLNTDDIEGVFCENIERDMKDTHPLVLYPGPFQALRFIATDVEMPGIVPAPDRDDVPDIFAPLDVWGEPWSTATEGIVDLWADGSGSDSEGDFGHDTSPEL